MIEQGVVAGRACGDCAMCCHLPKIPALEKQAGEWCVHCVTQSSCGNYELRPAMCQEFFCLYMLNANLGEEWKPAVARFLITTKGDGADSQIVVMVDPEQPDAWRRAPYFSTLQLWSGQMWLIVSCGARQTVLFPDHEVDLGMVGPGDVIEFIGIPTPQGLRKTAQLRKAVAH